MIESLLASKSDGRIPPLGCYGLTREIPAQEVCMSLDGACLRIAPFVPRRARRFQRVILLSNIDLEV